MAVVEFQKRASLHEVCREFTRRHQHDGLRRAPILTDLAEMVMPSQSMLRDGASSMGKRSGSPAPWFAPAAELLDEIERGAVQWDREARHTLGLECDAWRDPHDALEGLPGMVTILSDRGHPLGIRLGAAGEASDGLIEADVRDWYRRARIVLGDLAPAERLPTVANPDHPSNGGRARLGSDDRLAALRRLDAEARRLEATATGPSLPAHLARERAASHAHGGRSVFGWEPAPRQPATGR